MIIDYRAYTFKPGSIPTFYKMFESEGLEPQQRILGNFLGMYHLILDWATPGKCLVLI